MIDLCTSYGRACTNHFCHLKVALEAEEAHAEELREAKSRYVQCDQSSQAKVGGADPRKKFIGKNSKTP